MNFRPFGPEPNALAKLSYAPIGFLYPKKIAHPVNLNGPRRRTREIHMIRPVLANGPRRTRTQVPLDLDNRENKWVRQFAGSSAHPALSPRRLLVRDN